MSVTSYTVQALFVKYNLFNFQQITVVFIVYLVEALFTLVAIVKKSGFKEIFLLLCNKIATRDFVSDFFATAVKWTL